MESTPVRLNEKNEELCDYENCSNKAYRNIFQNVGKPNAFWCCLCHKHFESEKKRLKGKSYYAPIGVDCDE